MKAGTVLLGVAGVAAVFGLGALLTGQFDSGPSAEENGGWNSANLNVWAKANNVQVLIPNVKPTEGRSIILSGDQITAVGLPQVSAGQQLVWFPGTQYIRVSAGIDEPNPIDEVATASFKAFLEGYRGN